MLEVYPAQRMIRVRPVSVPRPYHEAALGVVRRKDDLAYWVGLNRDFGVPWGPWGFGSGVGVEDVDRDEAVEMGVMKEEDVVRPVERKFNEGLQAGVRDISGDMLAALERSTGGEAARGALRIQASRFKEAVLPDPDGSGTIEMDDEIYENLRELTAVKSWGAAGVFDGISGKEVAKYRDSEAKELRGAAVEEGLLLDRAGKSHRKTGGKNRIKWPEELLPSALMSHTHPAGSSFSVDDVETALMFGMKGVRAITEERVFSMRPGRRDFPLAAAGDLARSREFKQAHREAIAVMRAALSDKGTADERNDLITRLVWARLHQMGIIEYQEESWEK